MVANQRTESLVLGADHQDRRDARHRTLGEDLAFGIGGETDPPIPCFSKGIERAHEIRDPDKGQVFHCSCGSLDQCRGQFGSPIPGQDEATEPSGLGTSSDCPDVSWVSHAIKRKQELGTSL